MHYARLLVEALDPAPPDEVLAAARSLRHRDFLVVGLIVDRPQVFPDNWIYIHTPGVRVGRVQNFKNWSPAMNPDASKTGLGMEYFVWRNDDMWNASDDSLIATNFGSSASSAHIFGVRSTEYDTGLL